MQLRVTRLNVEGKACATENAVRCVHFCGIKLWRIVGHRGVFVSSGALHGMADGLFIQRYSMGLDRNTNVPLFVGLLSLLVRSFFDRSTKGQKFGGLPSLLGFIFLDRSTKGQKFGGT